MGAAISLKVNMAGKGDKLRKNANLRSYWDNYDRIFRREPKINETPKKENEIKEAKNIDLPT